MDTRRLALGTAQFGLRYGIANTTGQVGMDEIAAIMDFARNHGINTLDTAIAYGESERRLGTAGVDGWLVNSKLPAIPQDCADVAGWVERSVVESLRRLKIERLNGLLLHRPQQLLLPAGEVLFKALENLQCRRLVFNIGISVYAPDEVELLLQNYTIDMVQVPFNVLDRRLVSSGCAERLADAGVETHVRSVFLQGLLLMPPSQRPAYFLRWQQLFERWEAWLDQSRQTPLEGCLAFVGSASNVDKILVGVDSLVQMTEIVAACKSTPQTLLPDDLATEDLDLLDPTRWKCSA